ncbi:MAG: TonB-dependent receptor [Phenylobacterium sp.]|uniref:TonB-dependent siderophore receptor n=1 Tax=Phenylobacterium sp. TaxID=1871053 RepID=UPI001216654D|nr:TonB-dependent receptor [Phenylobacterium sp.]TAJ69530.1 MAG: TonB-dependent receptor [Phenylobacterium sp.]
MRILFAAMAAALASSPAWAQRADDNAVKSADDAFGTSVGNEDIGLYRPVEVRGFSAVDAGNVRIDGLYFDRQTDLSALIAPGQTIRVGISAQGYPLPAPTGIVDSELVRVGDKRVVSLVASRGPFDGYLAEVNAKLPLVEGRFGLALGASVSKYAYEYGNSERDVSLSAAAQWRPVDGLEIVPFYDRYAVTRAEALPLIFVDGPHLPPRFKRGRFFGQAWTDGENVGTNYGVVATAALAAGWTVKGGLFRSVFKSERSFADLYLNTTAAGVADHLIIADPAQSFASTSGELRLSRSFEEGPRRHTVHLIVRGRDQDRRYGGSDVFEAGKAVVGVPVDLPEPAFIFGPRTRDKVSQWTGAAAYQGRWDAFELSGGLQRTRYRKTVREPAAQPQEGRDDAWLYNLAGAWKATDRLAFYASYTTGLEEGGVAPENASNKNAAPPAIRTKQVDAGLRYALTSELKVVAGVFDVRKPYYNLDRANLYRELGEERHKGVEVSLSGQLASGLTVVAGVVLMRPRVTGEEVDAGRIGKIPVAQVKRLAIVGLDYQLPWVERLSVSATVTSLSAREVSRDNQLQIPARTTLDLGARYRFKVGDAPATVRVSVANVFDKYGFRTNTSGVFTPLAQRRYSITLAADF